MSELSMLIDRVYVAETEQDINDALQLRYEHVCKWNQYQGDRGGAAATVGDEFDQWTDYIIHRSESGSIDGVLRLIRRNPNGFFMGQYVNLFDHLIVDEHTIELCELVTHKDSRTNARIIGGILVCLGKYLIDRNATTMGAISVDQMHPMMIKLGFKKIGNGFMTGWDRRMTLFTCDQLVRVLHGIINISPKSLRIPIGNYLGLEL